MNVKSLGPNGMYQKSFWMSHICIYHTYIIHKISKLYFVIFLGMSIVIIVGVALCVGLFILLIGVVCLRRYVVLIMLLLIE